MAINTTRLKNAQVPRNVTYDLTSQVDGHTQTFTLPKKVHTQDNHFLLFNGQTYRNSSARTFYRISSDGLTLTTFFNYPPTPGPNYVLQFIKTENAEGTEPFATESYVNTRLSETKQAAVAEAKVYTDTRETAIRASIPTKVSQLDNDSHFITQTAVDTHNTASAAHTDIRGLISDEADSREAADDILQAEIDAIVAKSDVVDIVGTYAELQQYDTSKLSNKDIIKVMSDETHGNAISYYRWNKPNNVFDYIGSEGPYLTPSAAAGLYVPLTRTINGNPLTNNITITAASIGAAVPSDIPVNVSELTNDADYQTGADVTTTLGSYYNKTSIDAMFLNITTNYATKAYVDAITGDIGAILDNIHGGNITISGGNE